jgi:FAD/FMN-containing dehydrogenase
VPGSPQPDVRAIEWIDGRGLALVRDAASSPSIAVAPPGDAGSALIFELELSEAIDAERAATILAGSGPRSPLSRLAEILEAHDAADATILALPGDESQRRSIAALREAVPLRVNELLAARRREGAPVAKVGGDLIVPFGRLPEAVASYEDAFRGAGLEYAIWGHLSDGNLHPNALARDTTEARCAEAVMAELADVAIRLGGAPLSEHGVGRSPLKQRLLRRFLGDAALEEMRSIKAALDPRGRLAPGVLLPARRHGA